MKKDIEGIISHLLMKLKDQNIKQYGVSLIWEGLFNPGDELNELLDVIGETEYELVDYSFRVRPMGGDSVAYKYTLTIYDSQPKP